MFRGFTDQRRWDKISNFSFDFAVGHSHPLCFPRDAFWSHFHKDLIAIFLLSGACSQHSCFHVRTSDTNMLFIQEVHILDFLSKVRIHGNEESGFSGPSLSFTLDVVWVNLGSVIEMLHSLTPSR